jgi:hypothetical protein
MSEARKGREVSEYSRRRTSETWKGRTHTEEAKRKMSEAAKRRRGGNEEVKSPASTMPIKQTSFQLILF